MNRRIRQAAGQSIIMLGVFISALIIFSLGLFGFELNRVEIARTQLRSACEAAALAGAATLASQNNLDPAAAHSEAITTSLTQFQQNSIIGFNLNGAILAPFKDYAPGSNDSAIFIEFLDPNNNNREVPIGDSRGKTVRVSGVFGLEPAFGKFLGLGTVPLRAVALGGVPDLDVVLCFDVSGSIDDQTPVTFVKRAWSGTATTGRIANTVCNTRSGSVAGPLAQGRIYDILGPVPTGTRVNGTYPQYLASSSQSDVRWPLSFSETLSASRRLRGATNQGSPPGNFPPGTSSVGNQYTYTDLVVNIDGRNQFGGFVTPDGYSFPDVATLVEASRGNLENGTVFTQSKANTGVPSTVTPRVGYQQKYFEMAAANCRPIKDAQDASRDFFTIMNTNTNAHFALIAFSDNAGTSVNGGYSAPRVDSNYTAAGNGTFPIPNVALNRAVGVTNYDTVCQKLPMTVATTSTNIGEAVYRAVQQLNSQSRPGSKKAIVLFTDGMPTAGNPLNADPKRNARLAAVEAKRAGIPIYTIGLAQNPEIIPEEVEILNDTNSNQTSGGMAAIAGNGGKFFLVTDVNDLRKTFQNIARQLVQLVR